MMCAHSVLQEVELLSRRQFTMNHHECEITITCICILCCRFYIDTCFASCLFQNLRSDLNSKVFEDLLAFVAHCHKSTWCRGAIREIPAAALITGWTSIFLNTTLVTYLKVIAEASVVANNWNIFIVWEFTVRTRDPLSLYFFFLTLPGLKFLIEM